MAFLIHSELRCTVNHTSDNQVCFSQNWFSNFLQELCHVKKKFRSDSCEWNLQLENVISFTIFERDVQNNCDNQATLMDDQTILKVLYSKSLHTIQYITLVIPSSVLMNSVQNRTAINCVMSPYWGNNRSFNSKKRISLLCHDFRHVANFDPNLTLTWPCIVINSYNKTN